MDNGKLTNLFTEYAASGEDEVELKSTRKAEITNGYDSKEYYFRLSKKALQLFASFQLSTKFVKAFIASTGIDSSDQNHSTLVLNLYDFVTMSYDLFSYTEPQSNRVVGVYDAADFDSSVNFLNSLVSLSLDSSGKYSVIGKFQTEKYDTLLNVIRKMLETMTISWLVLISNLQSGNEVVMKYTFPFALRGFFYDMNNNAKVEIEELYPKVQAEDSACYINRINFFDRQKLLEEYESFINTQKLTELFSIILDYDQSLAYKIDFSRVISILNTDTKMAEVLKVAMVSLYYLKTKNLIFMEV